MVQTEEQRELTQRGVDLVDRAIRDVWDIVTREPVELTRTSLYPYGFVITNARAIWKIVEEITKQNLRFYAEELGLRYEEPVGTLDIMDCILHFPDYPNPVHVNIKASLTTATSTSNDVSKAPGLIHFYRDNPDALLVLSTVKIEMDGVIMNFDRNITNPVPWFKSVKYNKRNHNFQTNTSSLVGNIYRTNSEFITQLRVKVDNVGHQDTYTV